MRYKAREAYVPRTRWRVWLNEKSTHTFLSRYRPSFASNQRCQCRISDEALALPLHLRSRRWARCGCTERVGDTETVDAWTQVNACVAVGEYVRATYRGRQHVICYPETCKDMGPATAESLSDGETPDQCSDRCIHEETACEQHEPVDKCLARRVICLRACPNHGLPH